MDPRFNNNYGTFVIPPGCGEVEMWREDVEMDLQGSELPHPVRVVERAVLTETIEYHMQRRRNRGFGFRLCSEGSNVTISDIGDEVCNLCNGDILTHVDGQPVLGSLKVATRFLTHAGDTVLLRIRASTSDPQHLVHDGNSGYKFVQHKVRQGDSIDTIAELYGTTMEQMRSDNRRYFPLGEPGFLRPGQTLMIRSRQSKNHKGWDRREALRGLRRQVIYDVQEGDSLDSICTAFGAQGAEVRRCNRHVFPLGEAGKLAPGQVLTLFVPNNDALELT